MQDGAVGSDRGHLFDLELQVVVGRVEELGHLEQIEPVVVSVLELVIAGQFVLFRSLSRTLLLQPDELVDLIELFVG